MRFKKGNELSINKLKKISDNWIKGKKLYTEKEIFKIDINIIFNNLFYYNKIETDISEHYLTTYNSLKKMDGIKNFKLLLILVVVEKYIL